jgi:hypothetical protein
MLIFCSFLVQYVCLTSWWCVCSCGSDVPRSDIAGFLLFENQIRDVVTHRLASNPLFLRVLMRCLHWAVTRGFSLWHILEDWLTADSMESLYGSILTSLERGFLESPEATEAARNMSVAAGSLSALKTLYSWHPSFQKLDEQGSTEMLAIDFQYGNSASGATTGQKGGGGMHHNSVSGDGMGMTSAGGQQWLIASQQAEAKLEGARVDTQRSMDAMVKRAKRMAEDEHIKYVDAFIRIQQEVLESQMEDDESVTVDDETASNTSFSVLDNEDDDLSVGEKAAVILEGSEEEENEAEERDTFLTATHEEEEEEKEKATSPKSDTRLLAESFSDCAIANALRGLGKEEVTKKNLEQFNASLERLEAEAGASTSQKKTRSVSVCTVRSPRVCI